MYEPGIIKLAVCKNLALGAGAKSVHILDNGS